MNRKINWNSCEFDEIELVYEKAASNEYIGKLLEQLEAAALSEAKNNCGLLTTDSGKHITPEQFDAISDTDKETVIKVLSEIGLASISQDIQTAAIFIRFTEKIQSVLACTIFNVLNRLEKLDGAINLLKPKWTLELQIPLGGKKGLFQWELLIMQLYPWLSVSETSANEAAGTPASAMRHTSQGTPKAPQKGSQKAKNSEDFFEEMKQHPAFLSVFDHAKTEFGEAIQTGRFSFHDQNKLLTYDQWCKLSELDQLNFVLAIGNHGISVRSCICVDFAEIIPNCIALMLLYSVWNGQGNKQLIDAGDNTDTTRFAEALTLLHSCYKQWECTIANPVLIEIGKSPVAGISHAETKQKKKSFWKNLFGKKNR